MIPLALFVVFGAIAGQNAPAPLVLPDAVRTHLKTETFAPVVHVADLPKPVQDALKTFFDTKTLDIADPGKDFQATDVIMTPDLPIRRLIVAGCAADHCLVHYEKGGFAHSYEIAVVSINKTGASVQSHQLTNGALGTLADVKSEVVNRRARD